MITAVHHLGGNFRISLRFKSVTFSGKLGFEFRVIFDDAYLIWVNFSYLIQVNLPLSGKLYFSYLIRVMLTIH